MPGIFDDSYNFEIGKGVQLKEGRDVAIIATGLLVSEALDAAELLKNQGISARVINIATIKPIDREIIIAAARETGAIVTAEEHSISAGAAQSTRRCGLCKGAPVKSRG